MIIRTQDRLEIVKIAKQEIETPSQIWAFGSRVNGDAHDMSDLDLVIVPNGDEKLPMIEIINFKERLQESNIPIIVQVMDWNRIPKSFHNNILISHEVMIATDP